MGDSVDLSNTTYSLGLFVGILRIFSPNMMRLGPAMQRKRPAGHICRQTFAFRPGPR